MTEPFFTPEFEAELAALAHAEAIAQPFLWSDCYSCFRFYQVSEDGTTGEWFNVDPVPLLKSLIRVGIGALGFQLGDGFGWTMAHLENDWQIPAEAPEAWCPNVRGVSATVKQIRWCDHGRAETDLVAQSLMVECELLRRQVAELEAKVESAERYYHEVTQAIQRNPAERFAAAAYAYDIANYNKGDAADVAGDIARAILSGEHVTKLEHGELDETIASMGVLRTDVQAADRPTHPPRKHEFRAGMPGRARLASDSDVVHSTLIDIDRTEGGECELAVRKNGNIAMWVWEIGRGENSLTHMDVGKTVELVDGLVTCLRNSVSNRRPDDLTPDGRKHILQRMRVASSQFYANATMAGCHAFIEFTGLINEFIQLCQEAEDRGMEWVRANVHGDTHLPFSPQSYEYVNEKLECIYGVGLAEPPKIKVPDPDQLDLPHVGPRAALSLRHDVEDEVDRRCAAELFVRLACRCSKPAGATFIGQHNVCGCGGYLPIATVPDEVVALRAAELAQDPTPDGFLRGRLRGSERDGWTMHYHHVAGFWPLTAPSGGDQEAGWLAREMVDAGKEPTRQ